MNKLKEGYLSYNWDDLLVKEVNQAIRLYNDGESYLDYLSINQLLFLVDKHGYKSVQDRLKETNRLEDFYK